MISRLLITGFVVFLPTFAIADWGLVGRDEEMRVFVDRAPGIGDPDIARLWQLYDYTSARWVGHQVVYSVKNLAEYDCKARRARVIAGIGYSEQMAGGKQVGAQENPVAEWEEALPGSTTEQLWKMACDKR